MDKDDDELDGNNPTSMWRRNRKRKDFSDDEDIKPDMEEMEEEEHGEYKPFVHLASAPPSPPAPIPVVAVRVNVPLGNKRQNARMSTRWKAPRHALASINVVSTLIDMEF
jgi:hypothetical protein